MLTHLPSEGLDSLLALYNKIWEQECFPEKWLVSTKNPISKPGKYTNNPSSYRPNALTSVLRKVFERIINVRLLDFFDLKWTLLTIKCGGRAKRTTIDHLLSLEATMRKAQANSEQVVSIFFDMKNLYDWTWRHGIMIELNGGGIEGRMFKFKQNFLKPRSFKVKGNEFLSKVKFQTDGKPRGSVVSLTFLS